MKQALQLVQPLPSFDPSWAMFLDVDGTLLEFAQGPDEIQPRPDLVRILDGLRRSVPVALISGRPLVDLDRIAPLRLPAAGQHGAERRGADGRVHVPPISGENLDSVRQKLNAWMDLRSGVVLEDKGLSLALHYRRAPHLGEEAVRVLEDVAEGLGGAFMVRSGKMVAELRPSGYDKGRAIEEFMAEPPFAGRVPIFAGDDATDEEGFAAVNRLSGHSVKVGDGSTAARWRLEDVERVLEWLGRCARSGTVEPRGG